MASLVDRWLVRVACVRMVPWGIVEAFDVAFDLVGPCFRVELFSVFRFVRSQNPAVGAMAEGRDLRSQAAQSVPTTAGAEPVPAAWMEWLRRARGWLGTHPVLWGSAAAFLLILIVGAGYVVLRPAAKPNPAPKIAVASTEGWKPIADRVRQAVHGQFPVSEGIITISSSAHAAESEILSVVGTYALPDSGAAQIESGESWGVTGQNRDEFVMYVHNFLSAPLTAMIVRISEGSCASFNAQTQATWASAYWSDALPSGKEAVFHATLPTSHGEPSYCAIVYKVYSGRSL